MKGVPDWEFRVDGTQLLTAMQMSSEHSQYTIGLVIRHSPPASRSIFCDSSSSVNLSLSPVLQDIITILRWLIVTSMHLHVGPKIMG